MTSITKQVIIKAFNHRENEIHHYCFHCLVQSNSLSYMVIVFSNIFGYSKVG